MDKEFIDRLKKYLVEKKPKYHLVVMRPLGESHRYRGEHHDLRYVVEIANDVLGNEWILNAQSMFSNIADSLRVSPSGLVIPQGHGDMNAIPNLVSHFGGSLPNIPIFEAIRNAGDYLLQGEERAILNPQIKIAKDELVKVNYRNWLLKSVKPRPISVADLSLLG